MLTRCPRCQTTFRVTPEQLKARQGKVRCGECQEVFNALDTLIEAPAPPVMAAEVPVLPTPNLAPLEEEATPTPVDEAPPSAQQTDAAIETLDETANADAAGEPTDAEMEDEVTEAEAPADAEAAIEPAAEPEAESAPGAAEAAPEPALVAPPRRRAWPWLVGALTALGVLSLQAAMHFRTELAVLHPETKPWFAAACEIAGCTLLLPRKAELVSIETSDLHPENGGRLGLSATLKNRAPFAQEFPHLEITLTDTADRALVRRVLAPPEYLAAGTAIGAGFSAGREMPVDLSIEVADIPAVGYRLYLFYP